MPQLPTLTSYVEQWRTEFEKLPRNAPIPHRLVEQAIVLGRELADEPGSSVVHGNLHYGNVLAADREPWLAIAPRPLNGDPHYEVAPMLWSRWDELTGNIRDGVRRRFYTLVDAAGFDEERARAWVIVRVVRAATRELASATGLTKYVALAKAVQD
jgi:streptomycin 6-kinase